jgi:hypothetical protein
LFILGFILFSLFNILKVLNIKEFFLGIAESDGSVLFQKIKPMLSSGLDSFFAYAVPFVAKKSTK